MKPKREQSLLLGTLFLLPFTLLACVALLLFSSYREMDKSFKWVAHSNEVNTRIQNLLKNLLDAETGERGYLLTARNDYLDPYRTALENVNQEFELLLNLTRDNAAQQQTLSLLAGAIQRHLEVLAQTVALKKAGQDSEAARLVLSGQGKRAMDEIRNLTTILFERETALLRERESKADSHARFSHHLAVSLMLLDTLALAAIAYMLKRMQNLNRIVTVCAWSKTIKSEGRWISFEAYLQQQFGISVSHGMSKEVYDKLMDDPE